MGEHAGMLTMAGVDFGLHFVNRFLGLPFLYVTVGKRESTWRPSRAVGGVFERGREGGRGGATGRRWLRWLLVAEVAEVAVVASDAAVVQKQWHEAQLAANRNENLGIACLPARDLYLLTWLIPADMAYA